MRIGLVGVGRIGAFHAETLKGLDFVDELVVTDLFPEAARSVADQLGVGFAETPEALLASDVDGFVIATATPGHAPLLRLGIEAGVPDLLREAGRRDPRRDPRTSPSWSRVPTSRCTSGSSAASTAGYQRARAGGAPTASSGSSTPSGPTPTTRRRRTRPTSRRAVGCSATARSTTSTSSGSSPAARSSRSSRSAPTRAPRSSPRPATSTPRRPSSPSTTAPLSRVTATRYNGGGHDVRMEVIGSEGTIGVGLRPAPWPSPRPRRAWTTRGARDTGRSWSGSCPHTAPS